MAAKQNCGRVCKTFRLIKSVVTIPEIRNLYVTLYKFSTRQRTVNLAFFIARRMAQPAPGNKPGVMERIAVASVALGMAVMILAMAVIMGFKREVARKMTGFAAHVAVTDIRGVNALDAQPVCRCAHVEELIRRTDGFVAMAPYAVKGGIVRTADAVGEVMLKGVEADYDWSYFREWLVAGELPRVGGEVRTKDILLSRTLADKLLLGVGDKVEMLFVEPGEMPRRDRSRAIRMDVPVDLRQFFKSTTVKNFFGLAFVSYVPGDEDEPVETIARIVQDQLKTATQAEELKSRMNRMIALAKNPLLRLAPLFAKDFILGLANRLAARDVTTTMSNLGPIRIDERLALYIRDVNILTSTTGLNFLMCAFGDDLSIGISTVYSNPDVIKNICRFFSGQGIEGRININKTKEEVAEDRLEAKIEASVKRWGGQTPAREGASAKSEAPAHNETDAREDDGR